MSLRVRFGSGNPNITLILAGLLSLTQVVALAEPPAEKAAKPVALPALSMNVPESEFAKLSNGQKKTYVDELMKGVDAGAVVIPGALEAAEKHFATARKICRSEPRLEFAHGLVLAKQSKLDRAAEQFAKAKELSRGGLLAADFELIRTEIAQKKFDEAAASAKALARLLNGRGEATISMEVEQVAAHWLGRIAGYLQVATPTQETFDGLDSLMRESLPARVAKDFDAGLAVTDALHETLTSELEELIALDRARQENRERTEKQNAESDKTDAKTKQGDVGKAADDLKTEVNQKLNKIDNDITAMREQYDRLQGEIRRYSALMKELEETYQERERNPQTGKTVIRIRTRIRNKPLHQQYGQQRADCETQCSRLSQNAQFSAMLKNQAAAQGNQQLNRLGSEAQKLQREESLAAKRQRAAEKKLEDDSVKRSTKTNQLQIRVRRLDTYLPVTFADQRRLLLESLHQ